VTHIGFAERLAYLRWLLNRGRTDPITDIQLAERLGVGLKWLGKWKSRDEAPNGRSEALRISEAIKPWGASIDWLYDGKGEAPEPALWRAWLAARDEVTDPPPPGVRDVPVEAMERVSPAKKAPAKKRATGR